MDTEKSKAQGQVIPMRSRHRRTQPSAAATGIVTETQAAEVLRNYYRCYGRSQVAMEPSDRQIEAMVDALVLTFDLRLVQS